jgi:hypothetical protein
MAKSVRYWGGEAVGRVQSHPRISFYRALSNSNNPYCTVSVAGRMRMRSTVWTLDGQMDYLLIYRLIRVIVRKMGWNVLHKIRSRKVALEMINLRIKWTHIIQKFLA